VNIIETVQAVHEKSWQQYLMG